MDRRQFLGGGIAGSAAFAAAQSEHRKGESIQAQYAVIELMGFKRVACRVSQGFAGLLQLDVPVEGGFITQMINPSSIYRMTIVDEKTVREIAKNLDPMPTLELEVPARQTYLGLDRNDERDDYDTQY